MNKKQKNLVINLCLVLGSVLVMLALLEMYLHLTWRGSGLDPHDFSQELGWENKKNYRSSTWSDYYRKNITQIHNSMGIRDEREFGEKTKPRIVILGDSFVYGTGLDQTDIIGRKLQKLLPEHEVIAAGTVGYSTTQYLQYYEKYVRDFDPDIVVFARYLNDFAENSYDRIFGFTKPWTYRLTENLTLEKALPRIPQHPVVKPLPLPKPSFLLPEFYRKALGKLKSEPAQTYGDSPYRNNQAWYLMEDPYPVQANYAVVLDLSVMNLSKRTIEADGVTFVVVYIPIQHQVDIAYRDRVMSEFVDIGQFQFLYTKPNGIMNLFQQELGYQYFDFTPKLLGKADVSDYFLPDGHLSPKGTALLDTSLHEFLVANALV